MVKVYKTADEQYNEIVQDILDNGYSDEGQDVRTVYVDGTPAYTKGILNARMVFDNGKQFPIVTTKRVGMKDSLREIMWVWQKQSNDVNLLESMGSSVWAEWKDEKGEIGKAYGWQLANKKQDIIIDDLFIDMYYENKFSFGVHEKDILKTKEQLKEEIYKSSDEYELTVSLNQVDYLLYMLKKNPTSRRHMVTLWNVEDLHDMALQPCVYQSHLLVTDNKLNLTVSIRSNDIALIN